MLAYIILILGVSCGKPVEVKTFLRVGTSGDYEPFSIVDDHGQYEGYEIALAEAFAEDEGFEIKWVPFQWPELLSGLESRRYDLVMSGVTIRADRSLKAHFSIPTATSGAVVIIPSGSELQNMTDVDQPATRLGVNAGGHLERVTRQQFVNAEVVTSDQNLELPDLLNEGKIDALVTDTMEAPFWLERLEGARMLSPFTQDLKAALVHADRGDLATLLNNWIIEQEISGRLSALRKTHLPSGNYLKTADPFHALLAAMKERLSLMAEVAESKRATGKAVEDIVQEQRVLEAAVQGVAKRAREDGLTAPNLEHVSQYFRAQIEAAKAIQRHVLEKPASTDDPLDLVIELRPALSRISAKINQLICRLPEAETIEEEQARKEITLALTMEGLDDSDLSMMVDALWVLLAASSSG